MSAAPNVLHPTHPWIMPLFSQKNRSIASTDFGLQQVSSELQHTESMSVNCPEIVHSSPSWFCSAVVCGKQTDTEPSAGAHPNWFEQQQSNSSPVCGFNPGECHIPQPVLALFVYLAQQGVSVSDMFRRPGNVSHMRLILERFNSGESISWDEYNVYTVANVAKKLLLSIPHGLFGPDGEAELLATAHHASCSSELLERVSPGSTSSTITQNQCGDVGDDGRTSGLDEWRPKSVSFVLDSARAIDHQYSPQNDAPWPLATMLQLKQMYAIGEKRVSTCLRILTTLPPSHQQMIILMLGILHQLIFRLPPDTTIGEDSRSSLMPVPIDTCSDIGEISSAPSDIPLLTLAEGVVKSVAGTLFHTCSVSVSRVEQAAQVLRSLVIYFPMMGDSVMRFYLDAVAGRLDPLVTCFPRMPVGQAQALTAVAHKNLNMDAFGNGKSKSVCVLCPKGDHSLYFGHASVASNTRHQCANNFRQVASRLFCLTGSNTPTHSPHTTSNIKRTIHKPHFRKRSKEGLNVKETIPSITVEDTGLQSTFKRNTGHLHQTTEPQDNRTTNTKQASKTEQQQPVERPMLLRRNQSRYRSLKRRQMENLSRRAEWFLGPTIIPVVTLKPPWLCGSQQDQTHQTMQTSDMIVQSTMSLLELCEPLEPTRKSNADHLLYPPRVLFTASTGELVNDTDCDDDAIRKTSSERKRLLSVDSFHSESFTSIHSAPPPMHTNVENTHERLDASGSYDSQMRNFNPEPETSCVQPSPRTISP